MLDMPKNVLRLCLKECAALCNFFLVNGAVNLTIFFPFLEVLFNEILLEHFLVCCIVIMSLAFLEQ